MPRPVHFEIHADQPERAIAFYSTLFGWTFTAYGPPGTYWLVTTGSAPEPGIDGGLMKRMGAAPTDGQAVNAYVCTVGVSDIDASLRDAMANGGREALAKMPVPGVGWLAYCKDPEGNIFGMMQNDPNAR